MQFLFPDGGVGQIRCDAFESQNSAFQLTFASEYASNRAAEVGDVPGHVPAACGKHNRKPSYLVELQAVVSS